MACASPASAPEGSQVVEAPPLHVRLRLGRGGRAPTALYDLERDRHTDGGIS